MIIKNKKDISKIDFDNFSLDELENIQRRKKIEYENNKKSKEMAEMYVIVLALSFRTKIEPSKLEGIVKEIGEIYNNYEDSEDIACGYILALFFMAEIEKEVSKLEIIEKKAKQIYEKYNYLEIVIKGYSFIIYWLSTKQNSVNALESLLNKIKDIYETLPSSRWKEHWLLSVEMSAVLKQHPEMEGGTKKFEKEKEGIAFIYVSMLSKLSRKQINKLDILRLVREARTIYNQYQYSIPISGEFVGTLISLSAKQETILELKETMNEAEDVYNHIDDLRIASGYAIILMLAFLKQTETGEQTNIEGKVKEIYRKYQSEIIAKVYIDILLRISLIQEKNEKNNSFREINNILQKYEQLNKSVEFFIDRLLMSEDSTDEHLEKCINIFMTLSNQENAENLLRNTKYNFLLKCIKTISDEEKKRLIEILIIVQTIKYYLIVKDPTSLKFGHYTSEKVLQLFLKQKEEKDGEKEKNKYLIRTKSRLNNVNYMNDPSEGKVLDHCLQLDWAFQKLSLKPSPWFLMSLTTAVDRLEMWAQYGNQAEGVCLVLEASDFSKVNSIFDVKSLVEEDFRADSSRELNKHSDFLYRIGYLGKPGNPINILYKEYNRDLGKEIYKINKELKKLKNKVKKINKDNLLYVAVDFYLEEIRYLFKLSDYSYESELRVLKYMPLEPDNPKIKIDDSGDIAKLFIERDNPIRIDEVIFGPKFSHPENVTPLLHLLDKNIKFRQSKIPFK